MLPLHPGITRRPRLLLTLSLALAWQVGVLLLAAPRGAAQAPPTTTVVFGAVADTYVSSAAPTTSFASDPQLHTDASPLSVIYLRFVVSGLAGQRVSRVRLRLTVSNMSVTGGTAHLISDTAWAESGVTFATRPLVDGPGLATLGPVGLGSTVEFDLGGAITGDGVYALAIDTTSTDGAWYLSTAAPIDQQPMLLLDLVVDPTPQVRILAPREGTGLFDGDVVTLQAEATDPVAGDLGAMVVWSSDLQGSLGTGAVVGSTLVAGQHALTASVTNDAGLTASATTHVTVVPRPGSNTPPLVTVTAPAGDLTVPAERAVTCTATATDFEDGSLADVLVWTSDIDGVLGTGASITTTLRPGTHHVTAIATDVGGLAGTAGATVVVLPPVTLSVTPVADAYVDAGKTRTNFGTSTQLRVGARPTRLGYVRFAVSGIGSRPVRDALLRLQVAATGTTGSDSGGLVRLISDKTWKERSLTYRTRLPLDGAVLGAVGAVVPGQIVDIPVTDAVVGNGVYTFALSSTSSRVVTYATRESRTPPALILTLGNAAPVVGITAPASGAVVFAGTPVTLAGTALDAEDGDRSAALTWTSSADGILGTGATVVATPVTPGMHTITATAIDLDGRAGEAKMALRVRGPNQPPAISITAPAAGTTVAAGTPITLAAVATDDFDTALEGRIQWSSSLSGSLGTGTRLKVTLAEGAHTVRALVTDSDGAATAATVDVTVTPTPPVVQITAPAPGATLRSGVAATFRAVATDATDGDLSRAVVWASDADGPLGTGATVTTARLSLGVHRITARVTDGAGLTAEAEQIVLVEPPPTGTAGVHDFRFGAGVEYGVQKATAEKPESKLWYNDGVWWGTLYRPSKGHRIHRLDPATQTWADTGVLVDQRAHSRQDALWDGTKLYLLSRFDGTGSTTRLLRYTYVPLLKTHLLDPGFPVSLPGGGTESMTLAKDSTGTLWVAYTLGSQVWVNSSAGSDTRWGTPFKLPVAQGTRVAADDIAAVVALPGAIGVFWSNQATDAFYFARHADGTPAATAASWSLQVVDQGGGVADDHFNLKPLADGRLVAVVKTSRTASAAVQVGLFVRSAAGAWSPLYPVTTVAFAPTRPQCLVDEVSHLVYVFYSSAKSAVYFKASDLNRVAFPAGLGTPLIADPASSDINNPTTTKQTISPATGFAVLASDHLDYFHAVR